MPEDLLTELPARAEVAVEGRTVRLKAWQYDVNGRGGWTVPVYLIDADLPENTDWDRTLTDHLYGGDDHYRLCQELVLGIGGLRLLRALGHDDIGRYHLKEGHAALLTLELLDEAAREAGRTSFNHEDVETVRRQCVFTHSHPRARGAGQVSARPGGAGAEANGTLRDAGHLLPRGRWGNLDSASIWLFGTDAPT